MKRSEAINDLAAALCKAQGELRAATKNRTNPAFKSHYADLGAVWDACREALVANGLSVAQGTVVDGEAVLMTTLLLHTSGQWLEGVYPLNPVKQDPQGWGSAYSYARRYALMAMLGIAAEDDDGAAASDGRGGVGRERDRPRPPDRSSVNREFAPAPRVATADDEPWPAYIARTLREANQAWMREMVRAEVPPDVRKEHATLCVEPQMVNHLCTRLIETRRVAPGDVGKDDNPAVRDAARAREAVLDFYGRTPRKIRAAVETHLAEKRAEKRTELGIGVADETMASSPADA